MSKLAQLQERKASIVKSMRELSDQAAADDRDFTEEEQGSYDAYEVDLATTDKAIAREQALIDREKSLVPTGDDGARAEPASRQAREVKVDVVGGEASGKFRDFGDFLSSVRQAAIEPHSIDQRLLRNAGPDGGNTLVPSEGGYLVPTEDAGLIIRRAYEQGQVLSRIDRKTLTIGDSMTVPYVDETSRATGSRFGGVRGYWRAQGDDGTSSKPSFGSMELKVKSLTCLGYLTDEMVQDASFSGAMLTDAFADEVRFQIEDAVFRGTGAGQPLGFTNASCKVRISKESSQSATTIVGDNLLKMVARFAPKSRMSPGRAFLYNQDCEPQLWKLSAYSTAVEGASSTADAMPLIVPSGQGLNASDYPTFLGIPFIPVEYCETLGTEGDIVLVDLAEYLLVERGTVQTASSMHVKFESQQMAYRVSVRVDGQPKWKSALTPYKGSSTVSPFITLQTRS